MIDPGELLTAARADKPWLQEIRRDLHQHPELGLEEHRTAKRVQGWLDELGIENVGGVGQTGVVGLIYGKAGQDSGGNSEGTSDGRTVALRADMDALPLQDAKEVPYRSQIAGKMHACGHDVHMTVLLGAARLLAERRDEFSGVVKLLFQPAEETVGGAQLMIADGVLEDPPVAAIFGLHVDPGMDVGSVGVRYGQRNASSDTVTLTINGRSGHGAYPAGAVDAIVVAAHVVTAIQSVVSRNIDARRSAVVSFGTVSGGTQGNIIANRVRLVGTVRALEPEIRSRVLERVKEIAEGVASGLGGSAELTVEPGYEPLINHDEIVDIVRGNVVRLVGEDRLVIRPYPNMGVEDFAYYVSRVPGAFFSLGVRNQAAGIVHPVHNELFDADEDCLALGAAVQALNALSVLEN